MTAGRGVSTAFLDRDGTLNVSPEYGSYITAPDQLVLLPGVADAVRLLNRAGARVIVVTNQRAIHLGLLDFAGLERVHRRLRELLWRSGAVVDEIYTCPHAYDSCVCRKPQPGLILRASHTDRRVDLSKAVTIGDAETDVLAGAAAGTRTVRLAPRGTATTADLTAPDLCAAVGQILSTKVRRRNPAGTEP